MTAAERAKRGRLGEDKACEYLMSRGFAIVGRNCHSRYGEIDIIASDERYVLFVEVKLRAACAPVSGLEAVTPSKMRKIVKTAALWLAEHPQQLQPRFDVIEINTFGVGDGIRFSVNHIESAFDGGVCREII